MNIDRATWIKTVTCTGWHLPWQATHRKAREAFIAKARAEAEAMGVELASEEPADWPDTPEGPGGWVFVWRTREKAS